MFGDVTLLALAIIFAILVAGAYVILSLVGVGIGALLFVVFFIAMLVGTGALIWYEIASGSPTTRDFLAVAVLWILLGIVAYRVRFMKKS